MHPGRSSEGGTLELDCGQITGWGWVFFSFSFFAGERSELNFWPYSFEKKLLKQQHFSHSFIY